VLSLDEDELAVTVAAGSIRCSNPEVVGKISDLSFGALRGLGCFCRCDGKLKMVGRTPASIKAYTLNN